MSATTETKVGSISGVFDDDALEQIRDVFAAVRGRLEEVENLLPLDHRDGVTLLVEELDDRILVDAIRFVLELFDARGHFEHAVAPFERMQRFGDAIERIADDLDEPLRTAADARDLIEPNHGRRRINGVHHIVERAGKRVNIFAVQRRDERTVEAVNDGPRAAIARVLDFLDRLDFRDIGGVRRDHLFQNAGTGTNFLRQADEFLEKVVVSRNQTKRGHRTSGAPIVARGGQPNCPRSGLVDKYPRKSMAYMPGIAGISL